MRPKKLWFIAWPFAEQKDATGCFRVGPRGSGHVSTRQYSRLVDTWVALVGLNPADYGAHSLSRTKVSLAYKQIGNLRAC